MTVASTKHETPNTKHRKTMAKFTDVKQREWTIEIFLPDITALRELGFDLNLLRKKSEVMEALADNEIFGRVIGHLCHEQIEQRNLSAAEFLKGFDGPTCWRAIYAIIEAYQSFPLPPMAAEAARRHLPKAIEANERRIADMIEESFGSSASAGNSPASPGSIPDG